jgi:hypothetical protein
LIYLRFYEEWGAEFSAIAEESAPQGEALDRRWSAPMRRGGSRSKGVDVSRPACGGHGARPARAVWPVPGASVSLSCFEALEGSAQGFDFRCERLPRQAQLGRRARGAGHPEAEGERADQLSV